MGKQTGNHRLARLRFRPVIECPMDAVEGLTLIAHRKEGELIAFLPKERPTAEDLNSGGSTHDWSAKHDSSDQPISMAIEKTEFSAPLLVAEQVPIVPNELPMAEEAKSGRSNHDSDRNLNLSKQPIGMTYEASGFSFPLPAAEQLSLFPNKLPTGENGRPRQDLGSQIDSQHFATARQTIDFAAAPRTKGGLINQFPNDRRIASSLARFFIAVLIGGGAVVAWQYSGGASKVARTEISPLDQLLSVSTAAPMPDTIHSSGAKADEIVGIPALTPGSATSSPTDWTTLPGSVPGTAAVSAALAPQLDAIARNLAYLQYGIAQLAEKREQMAENMATLPTSQRDISQKTLSLHVTRAVVPLPPRKPRVRWYRTR